MKFNWYVFHFFVWFAIALWSLGTFWIQIEFGIDEQMYFALMMLPISFFMLQIMKEEQEKWYMKK